MVYCPYVTRTRLFFGLNWDLISSTLIPDAVLGIVPPYDPGPSGIAKATESVVTLAKVEKKMSDFMVAEVPRKESADEAKRNKEIEQR
jgi:hypothetical protein